MSEPPKRTNQRARRGSVQRDASGRWFYIFDRDTFDGQRKQVRRRGFATRRDALEAMKLARALIERR